VNVSTGQASTSEPTAGTARVGSDMAGARATGSVTGRMSHSGGDALIRARQLVKRFDDFVAVDGIDVEVRPGESFGFLGPNGAGKSSTMRMIGCVSPVTEGHLTIFGLDPARDGKQIRARMGVVPQLDQLDEQLTVEDNMVLYGRYFDIPRAECRRRTKELLEFVQLADRAKSRIEPLSGGMKRRVTIARSLINEPELLLLDEPTTGLDPQARHVLWDRLYRLKQRGVTLVLTTHYMDEAEQLCDRLVVMDHGKIVAEGSPRDLITTHSTREVLELRYPAGTNEERSAEVAGIGERSELLPDRVLIYADDGEAALHEVHARDSMPESALVRRSSLEDVFLRLTGRTLVD
jgi:lipooligosaccharide transport system ATP-binding protein